MRAGTCNAELPSPFTIQEVREETPQVKRFILDRRIEATPGQFVMAWVPGVDEKPFSLMENAPATLAVARVGPFSQAVHALGPGDLLWLRGPFGNGFQLLGKDLLLVAGGYGAAPLAFLARIALEQGCRVTALIAARTEAYLLLPAHFRALGCRVLTCTDDGSDGHRPALAPDVAAELLHDHPFDALYACGPAPMLDALETLARERHIPAQLSREAYMRCGVGVCGSCTHGDQLVCRDGPVFHVR